MMIRIFPVRHHSPASSLLLQRVIAQRPPKLMLIEGPSDAQPLIDILTDAETAPPIAILAYAFPEAANAFAEPQDAAGPRYLLYPFADYSPEYVALTQARRLGIEARFVDIPSSLALNWYDRIEQMTSCDDLFETLTTRSGHRSFEEFWEAAFENGGLETDTFITSILDYARLLRERAEETPSPEFQKDLYREQVMAQHIAAACDEGYRPEDILLVCGAFHAAAFAELTPRPPLFPREGEQETLTPDPSPKGRGVTLPPLSSQERGPGGEFSPIAAELTVIPYSYPRLSEQSGYGAGNRAPFYYQKVYEHGGDFGQASLEMLVTFMNRLHFQGHTVSLANVIEANRLAKILASMRDKRAPGLDEVREALTACLLHGETALIDEFLWDLLVGRSVGKVSSKIGKTALQQEFYREVEQRKIPVNDSAQDFILHLTNATEIGASIFLHRLRIGNIPFARNTATVASAYDYLSQTREKWEVQWTPAVDAALVEQSLLGSSLAELCTRLLSQALSTAQNTRDAAEVLLEIAVCDVIGLLHQAIRACDAMASEDSDVVSLAKACQNLQALLAYGSSRKIPPADIEAMLTHAFSRAVLLLPAASAVSDDGVEALCTALKILSDLAVRSALVNADLFAEAVTDLMDSYAAHPKIAGLAASLAYQAKKLNDAQVVAALNQRLSAGNSALNGSWFLDGFFSLTKLVLVNNLTVVTLLDAFVQAIHPDEFLTALPVLRRAFADLSASERNYFLDNLGAAHHLAPNAAAQAVMQADADTLQELDAVSQALDDLF